MRRILDGSIGQTGPRRRKAFVPGRRILVPLLAVAGAAAMNMAAATEPVGSVLFSQGVTTSQREGKAPRFVGRGDRVEAGEVLSTGGRSFAVLELADGSKTTLRPGTVFRVEHLNQDAGKENALLRLFRGGLRMITGAIAKRNPSAYSVHTPVATIGIRGTEFDARLCEADCAREAKATAPAKPSPVARVALQQGEAVARTAGAAPRRLASGSAIYSGEVIETGPEAFAVIAFRDASRFTLQARTRFAVESYSFEETRREGSALFRLFKGALRAATGLIGRGAPQNFHLSTAVATIGIRGTGFDTSCEGPCAGEAITEPCPEPGGAVRDGACARDLPRPGSERPEDGFFATTWEGEIEVVTPGGPQIVRVGETVFVRDPKQPPRSLAQTPAFMRESPAPRPDTVPIELQQLFGPEAIEDKPGLFVWVRDGEVAVQKDGQEITAGRNDSIFAGAGATELARLPETPVFLRFDPIPSPAAVQPESQIVPLFRAPDSALEDNQCRF
jgi:hypothetical protein